MSDLQSIGQETCSDYLLSTLRYYTPDTSELTIISINLHKTVDSALQSAYKLEVTFHHGNTWRGLWPQPNSKYETISNNKKLNAQNFA